MRSIHYRGSAAAPGLVLALDAAADAACDGLALAVRKGEEARVLADLRARELISAAYLERRLPLDLEDGRRVEAVAYVIDRSHPQYCGALAPAEQARIIASARGERGANAEYLFNTAAHLAELGLHDVELERLASEVRALLGARPG